MAITNRKAVPSDMRQEFIKLFDQLRQSNSDLSKEELYMYTWKIQNAISLADWQMFKSNIGLK